MDKSNMTIGAIVQIKPDAKNKAFRGCFVTVTELKNYGIKGYVQTVGECKEKQGEQVWIRFEFDDFELCGTAV